MDICELGLMRFLLLCSLCVIGPLAYAEGSLAENYIGCYTLSNLPTPDTSNDLSIESCVNKCRGRNNTYAAVQGSKNCSCLDSIDTSYESNQCNMSCNGNQSEFCGGGPNGIYSIYTVCPIGLFGSECNISCHCKQQIPCDLNTGICPSNTCDGNWTGIACNNVSTSDIYIGCFDDNGPRTFPVDACGKNCSAWKYTSASCSAYCSDRDYTYFGLEWYDGCFCGNSLDNSRRKDESDCNTPCTGNQNEICGGYYTLSVYGVCPVGYYGDNCSAICNCGNNVRCNYSNGACTSGGCKPGWSGSTCSIRDCSKSNGGCSDNQTCVPMNLKYASVSLCTCSAGYQRSNLSDYCRDLDECSLDEPVCNASNSVCVNSVGNYTCVCQNGYTPVNSKLCMDVNECTSGYASCNATISNCTNTDGGYHCSCNDGYKNDDSTHCSDVDECSDGKSKCDPSSTHCMNSVGSYECICKEGFQTPNNSKCSDVNECLVGNGRCDNLTTICTNTIGGFNCACLDGYEQKSQFSCSISSSAQTGKIVGAVVGSILGLVLIVGIVLLLLYIFRKRGKPTEEKLTEGPYDEVEVVDGKGTSVRSVNVHSIYPVESGTQKQKATINALETVRNKLASPGLIQEEFQKVPLKTKDFSTLGSREEVKKKNRFLNIIPYDQNRVSLSRTSDDDSSEYINASYVQGYNDDDKFIAAQGPRSESVDDFWRMIIENDIHLIVMMTNLIENQKKKCVQYWPELGKTEVFGDVSVELEEEELWSSYAVRRIKASTNSKSVEILQWHYMIWPDHGVPKDAKCFLNFYRKVRQNMSPGRYTLVHCSAGAGRTGAFIATDYLLEQEKVEGNVDVYRCLLKLRDDRPSMIQTLLQYEFVHRALLKSFMIGNTSIPAKNFTSQYQSLQKKDNKADKTMLEIQFQDIKETKADTEETGKYRIWTNAIEQSKINEMDAVFIDSWKRKSAFVWTKLSDDHEHFWTLRKDQKSDIIIYIETAVDSDAEFLPSEERPIIHQDCRLSTESETKEKYGFCRLITESTNKVENNYENTTIDAIYQNSGITSPKSRISVLRLKEPTGGKWTNVDSLRSLFGFIERSRAEKSQTENCPVMITSRSHCSVAGFLVSMLNAIEMITLEKEVDLYQIVLNIRKSKPEFVCSMSSYIDLHDVVERYIKTSAA